MTQTILALAAALAFLFSAGSAATNHHSVSVVNPAEVTSPGPI